VVVEVVKAKAIEVSVAAAVALLLEEEIGTYG
jgi:hypothetical protein